MLKIYVDQLKEEPGEFELDVFPRELDLVDPVYQFEEHVRGKIEFRMAGHDVEGRGELKAHVATPCVRCLEPTKIELRVPFHEVWFRKSAEDDPEAVPFGQEEPADFTYTGEVLYPAEAFREVILAELPDLPLCKPDCKGLCAGCGANLNTEACRCAKGEAAGDAGAATATEEPEWKRALREMKKGS